MTIKNVICDIDGVLMHDNVAVPGAAEFLTGILEKGLPLVLLTTTRRKPAVIWRTVLLPLALTCRTACFIRQQWRQPIFCAVRKVRKRMSWAKARSFTSSIKRGLPLPM